MKEGRNGERTFQYFSDYTSCYSRTCSPPRQEEEEGTPQLLRPHEVPKFNTDFHGVIPAAILAFSLIFCRQSSFLGEETPSDSPGREAQTPAPMLPLAFLPACEKGAQTAPASGTPLPSAWGLCLRYPQSSGKPHWHLMEYLPTPLPQGAAPSTRGSNPCTPQGAALSSGNISLHPRTAHTSVSTPLCTSHA